MNLFGTRPYNSTEAEVGGLKAESGATNQKERCMDAKYNWLMDNAAVRLTLNTMVFALWAVASVGLLVLATKL
jgi:hypothetical protein